MIRASKYLGVDPWDLLDQGEEWMQWAIEAEHVDDKVEEIQRKRPKLNP